MVQAPGAMALFVLRLAGLLTIEKALNEQRDNQTANSSLALSMQYPFNLSIADVNVTAPLFNPDSSFGGSSRASSQIHEEDTRDSSPILKGLPEFFHEEPSSGTNGKTGGVVETEVRSSGWTKKLEKTIKHDFRQPETSTTSELPVLTGSAAAVDRQQDAGDEGQREGYGNRNRIHAEGKLAGKLLTAETSGKNLKKEKQEDPDLSVIKLQEVEAPLPPVTDDSTKKTRKNEGISSWDAARPSHNNPPGTQGLGEILEEEEDASATTHTKRRTQVITKSSSPTVVQKLPVAQPLSGTPTPALSSRSQPLNEGLIEDGHLFDIIDETQLWVPPTPRSLSSKEEPGTTPDLTDVTPTLPSRNLVSAIPRGDYYPERPPGSSGTQEGPLRGDTGGLDEETKEEKEELLVNVKPPMTTTDEPISDPHPSPHGSQDRTNPFPYGPNQLPGYRNPYDEEYIRNIFEANKKSTEKPYYEYEEHEYEEEDLYYEYPEGSQVKVHTAEPPVLFHFEKPGYSPKEPTTLSPPTRAPTPSDPWDCAPRCPRYELVDWNAEYDIRIYPRTAWVSTVIISSNRVLAELEGYMKVQDYFYGLNDRGLVLNLTVPFVTQIKFGKHPGVLEEVNDYTISLYVQPDYYRHSELPTPISNEVLLDEIEVKTVYVHNFEANVWDVTEDFLDKKATALMDQLRRNGEAFLDRYYYLASYGRPELYQPVYYELWVYATNFRDPHTPGKPLYAGTPPPANKVTEKTLDKLCRGVECPMFEVLRTYKYGIQKRRYHNALFASTSPTDCEFTTMSVWRGFMPLHLYKHGINSHMEVIEATRPIALVHITESPEVTTECPQNMTMSLYLPSRLHSNPPITGYGAPNVRITTLDNVIVYAYTVGGYLLDPVRVRKELSDLKYRLTEFGACYREYEYFVVVYDFIVRYHGRQNEIWIIAENCRATHNG